MARRAGAKVILAADIDTGGVFAQVLGTIDLMTPEEREMMAGVIINKFRGDASLFSEGMEFIASRSGVPVLGLVPRFEHILLPQEDGVALERGELAGRAGSVRVGVVRLGYISNYTDFDALAASEGVELSWLERPEDLAGLDLLILPGTKNTLAALKRLHQSGLFGAIQAFHQLGGKVLGLCGGYQLLGAEIADPQGVEGPSGTEAGLGLLPVSTVMAGDKTTTRVRARCGEGLPFAVGGEVSGYEIHMGRTQAQGQDRPAFCFTQVLGRDARQQEGQVSPDGRVVGTYLHGVLDNDDLRAALLSWARVGAAPEQAGNYAAFREEQFELLADLLEQNLNLDGLLEPVAGPE